MYATGTVQRKLAFTNKCRQRNKSVTSGISEGRSRDPELGFGRVEHGVEAFEERHPVDEVQTLTGVGPQIADDEIDVVRRTTQGRVQLSEAYPRQYDLFPEWMNWTYRPWPDLCVWSELVCFLPPSCISSSIL